jgi:hypothetical protein
MLLQMVKLRWLNYEFRKLMNYIVLKYKNKLILIYLKVLNDRLVFNKILSFSISFFNGISIMRMHLHIQQLLNSSLITFSTFIYGSSIHHRQLLYLPRSKIPATVSRGKAPEIPRKWKQYFNRKFFGFFLVVSCQLP